MTGLVLGERPAFLLGAGFSKSVSQCMPTMAELGQQLAASIAPESELWPLLSKSTQAALERGAVPYDDFETWLSLLAGDPPYLGGHQRDINRAAFKLLSGQIADVVLEAQAQTASDQEPPDWLVTLVALWHYTAAPVITLNYDMLIEATVRHPLNLFGRQGDRWERVQAGDLTLQRPALSAADLAGSYGAKYRPVETFRLLKLHGSLNWFWRLDHEPGQSGSVVRVDNHPPFWTEPNEKQAELGREATEKANYDEQRARMVVPPQADKSSLFRNGNISAIWRAAAESLRMATSLVLIGCSIPKTDIAVRGLITENLPAESPVHVFDLWPAGPSEELRKLGFIPTQRRWGDEEPDARNELISSLRETAYARAPVAQGQHGRGFEVVNALSQTATIERLTQTDDGVILHVGSRQGGNPTSKAHINKAVAKLISERERILVSTGSDFTVPVVDVVDDRSQLVELHVDNFPFR